MPMLRRFASVSSLCLLFLTFIITPCTADEPKAVDILNGQWKLSTDEIRKIPELANDPQFELITLMLSQMVIDFDAHKKQINVSSMGQSKIAPFKLLENNNKYVTLEVEGQKQKIILKDKDTATTTVKNKSKNISVTFLRIK